MAKESIAGVAYITAAGTPYILIASTEPELSQRLQQVIEEWEEWEV